MKNPWIYLLVTLLISSAVFSGLIYYNYYRPVLKEAYERSHFKFKSVYPTEEDYYFTDYNPNAISTFGDTIRVSSFARPMIDIFNVKDTLYRYECDFIQYRDPDYLSCIGISVTDTFYVDR